MIGLGALIKKELQEQLKTYKLPIVSGVFTVLFGLGLPLMIHYLNIHIVVGDAELEMPVMTGVEVLGAYAGHLELWGVLTVILIGMGAIARERKSGTAAMTLCKPVGRGAFVIAKLVGLGVTFFISLGLAGLVCYNFTYILFEEVNGLPAFLYLNLLLGLFFLACLSMVLLCSSLFKHQLAAGGLGLAFVMGQGVVSWIPRIGDYAPTRLVSWGRGLVEMGDVPGAWSAVGASFGIVVVCLFLSWHILQRKEL
ncbi:ABC transporter permease [Dehalococcoidia bacterium]|nr:ABC transporter permease [Dehalococcoidia bacterium]